MQEANKENVPVTTSKEAAKSEVPAIRPMTEMERTFTEMERTFDRVFRRGWPSLWRWGGMPALDNLFELEAPRSPSLDVIDRDNEILVRAEIPGIEKKDLNISLTGNLLTIKGQSVSDVKEEKGDFHRHEISSFSFSRSVALPGEVDTSKTEASLKNGILEITLPKAESSKRRTITVQ
ncbi:Hsp20/alpha crystallin family protein [Nitrosomonas sp. Nm33]|uniref:Hsp20/alpha crystallin family protein n=1 Tax=Nitrosomonas sp. Nm33 TaxID=133724 RepID=UPI00089B3E70|nr:Hsp20/alpha crystallin family protein [Nitrosomonas sp. Nm33]SDY69428.1 HSP20 family protein [Nitrosomonas sp. Nm33]